MAVPAGLCQSAHALERGERQLRVELTQAIRNSSRTMAAAAEPSCAVPYAP